MAPGKYLDVSYTAHTFLKFLNYLSSSVFSRLELVNEVVYKAPVSISKYPLRCLEKITSKMLKIAIIIPFSFRYGIFKATWNPKTS